MFFIFTKKNNRNFPKEKSFLKAFIKARTKNREAFKKLNAFKLFWKKVELNKSLISWNNRQKNRATIVKEIIDKAVAILKMQNRIKHSIFRHQKNRIYF